MIIKGRAKKYLNDEQKKKPLKDKVDKTNTVNVKTYHW